LPCALAQGLKDAGRKCMTALAAFIESQLLWMIQMVQSPFLIRAFSTSL